MQSCVRFVVCHVNAVAAFFQIFGVEIMVDVADELEIETLNSNNMVIGVNVATSYDLHEQ